MNKIARNNGKNFVRATCYDTSRSLKRFTKERIKRRETISRNLFSPPLFATYVNVPRASCPTIHQPLHLPNDLPPQGKTLPSGSFSFLEPLCCILDAIKSSSDEGSDRHKFERRVRFAETIVEGRCMHLEHKFEPLPSSIVSSVVNRSYFYRGNVDVGGRGGGERSKKQNLAFPFCLLFRVTTTTSRHLSRVTRRDTCQRACKRCSSTEFDPCGAPRPI